MKPVKIKWKEHPVQEKNRKSFVKEISIWTNILVSVR